ncbi:MAG: hypothetical protein V1755_15640 [Chloroflexota bacterium]
MKVASPKSPIRIIAGLSSKLARARRAVSVPDAVMVISGTALAIALRLSLLEFRSLDFYASLKPWYNIIRAEGFSAFASGFSTYNPPYLYLLYLIARIWPDLPVIAAVKLPSVVADFVCAYLVFLIVRAASGQRSLMTLLAGFAVLFAPSVVLNSSFWGQADSLYTAGILACVYFLILRRPGLAMLCFGTALAFKLQAIFLAPVLLALLLKGNLPWRAVLAVPLMLFLAIIPSWLAGRPLAELLGVYSYQASQFEFITMNAPTIYAWLPNTKQVFNLLYAPGVLMGAAAAFMWFILLFKAPRQIEGRLLLEVALVSLLAVPLFLPKMHERYFFPADVLAIALAFLYPRLYYVPILVVGVSFLSYQPFLFERDFVPLHLLALVLASAIGMLSCHALRQLYGTATSGDTASGGAKRGSLEQIEVDGAVV